MAVVGADGTVRGTARGGGFHPPVAGVAAAVDALAASVREAARAAGADLPHGTAGHLPGGPAREGAGGAPPFAAVSACLANVDLPREERAMEAALRARGWARDTQVANDTFALLRAGLPDDGSARHGVAVVCGAGINCVGRTDDGRTHRFPALGRLSGDWGGGGGLVDEALWHAARAADGRGGPTALEQALPARFGLVDMGALIEALHLGDLRPGRRVELAPVLFEAAAAGDPVARSLVLRQAEEVVALAAVTLERLELLDRPTPVLLGGGVLAARHPLLHDALTERLAARAPYAEPLLITAPPVLGAALLGLDRLGAAAPAYARLRAHYAGAAAGAALPRTGPAAG